MNRKTSALKLGSGFLLEKLAPWQGCRVKVAFSGGVDSTVLLHLAVMLRNQGVLDSVEALHIHHGLSVQADRWVTHCRHICELWDVAVQIVEVDVSANSGEGLEQAARKARYEIFENNLDENDCLLQGHHSNDQAETLLLRLFRGTGLEGLGGIPEFRSLGRGCLVRPLLDCSREDIEAYALRYQLEHIEDDSNIDERFSRNFLRHSLIPAIEQRWPGASSRIAELSKEITDVNARQSLNVITAMNRCIAKRPEWLLGEQLLLELAELDAFDGLFQRQIVRQWLKIQKYLMPGREALERVFHEVIAAADDSLPVLNAGEYCFRRFRGMLIVTATDRPVDYYPIFWNWQETSEFELMDGRILALDLQGDNTRLGIELPGYPVEVKWRKHIDKNEKIAIEGRQGRKTLKKWLQEYNVPPWLRERLPFLYDGERMIAAPGLWICKGYKDESGRVVVRWN